MNRVIGGIFWLLTGSSSATAASCVLEDTSAQVVFTVPPLTVQRDLPPGSIIWQQTVAATAPRLTDECSRGEESHLNMLGQESGLLSGRNPVYSTSVPGIGYAVATDTTFSDGWPAPPGQSGITSFSMRLVVTGQIASGVLNIGEYARRNVDGQAVQQIVVQHPAAITRLACELNSSREMVVPLNNVPRTGFSGIGSSQGEQVFHLGLSCDAGTQVNIQFDGEAEGDGSQGVLTLLNKGDKGVAKGVGIQLLYHQAPLPLGKKLLLETAPAGLRSYPFSARYYQTEARVTSGDADAVATFSLTYQ